MSQSTISSIHRQVLALRTQYRAAPCLSTVQDIEALEQLIRDTKRLRDDMIASAIASGEDYESLSIKHRLSVSRISQINSSLHKLSKNSPLRPTQYQTPRPYTAPRRYHR